MLKISQNNDNRGRHLEFYFHTGIGNWFQCFPVYPGLNLSSGSCSGSVSGSGSGFRIFALLYAPDFSFTCKCKVIFPFLCLLYCEVLMILVCNSKEFQFLNELHELNQAVFHSQVVNSDRVERKKNMIKI